MNDAITRMVITGRRMQSADMVENPDCRLAARRRGLGWLVRRGGLATSGCRTVTEAPLTRRNWPSITTDSPALSPLPTTDSPYCVRLIDDGRTSAMLPSLMTNT